MASGRPVVLDASKTPTCVTSTLIVTLSDARSRGERSPRTRYASDVPGLGALGKVEHEVTVVGPHIDPGRARPQRVDHAGHRRGGLARARQRGEQHLDLTGQFLARRARTGPTYVRSSTRLGSRS